MRWRYSGRRVRESVAVRWMRRLLRTIRICKYPLVKNSQGLFRGPQPVSDARAPQFAGTATMSYIKSRKHAPRALQPHTSARAAATLITGLTLALPAAAQDASGQKSPTQSKTLGKITVEDGDTTPSYKI